MALEDDLIVAAISRGSSTQSVDGPAGQSRLRRSAMARNLGPGGEVGSGQMVRKSR